MAEPVPRAAGSRCTASCGPSQNCWTDRQTAQPTNIFTSTASSRNHACHVEKGNTEAKNLTVPQSQQNEDGHAEKQRQQTKSWKHTRCLLTALAC